MGFFSVWALLLENPANSVSSTSRESGSVSIVEACLKPDPFGLRAEDRSDDEDSLEANDSEDPRGDTPGRWDVIYGLKVLEVLLGYGLPPG